MQEQITNPSVSSATHTRPNNASRDAQGSCSSGLCSVGLIKSFCPTCVILGVLMLPFELIRRAWRSRR